MNEEEPSLEDIFPETTMENKANTSGQGLKAVYIFLILFIVLVAVVAAFLFWPRPTLRGKTEPACIELPEVTDESVRQAALDVGMELNLEEIPIDGKLKASFEEASKKTFEKLSEKQVAFLLLLRAIHCYIKSADTPEKQELVKQIAPELIATVRSLWASEHELRGEADRLSIKERDILDASPFGSAILSELKKHNIE